MHFSGIIKYDHIIRNLYSIDVNEPDKRLAYLVDIDKKQTIRVLDRLDTHYRLNIYLTVGKIIRSVLKRRGVLVMEEYGAL